MERARIDSLLSRTQAQLTTILQKRNSIRKPGDSDSYAEAHRVTEADVSEFMNNIYELGLAVNSDYSLSDSDAFQSFLRASAEDLSLLTMHISHFVSDFDGWLSGQEWEAEWFSYKTVWPAACVKRSSIEFLFELYSDTSFESDLKNFIADDEVADVDEILRRQAWRHGYLAEGERPAAIPRSHWWWWPDEIESPA